MYNDHRAFKVLSLCKYELLVSINISHLWLALTDSGLIRTKAYKGTKIRGGLLEKNIMKSSPQNFGKSKIFISFKLTIFLTKNANISD